jgi:uncharacterized protein
MILGYCFEMSIYIYVRQCTAVIQNCRGKNVFILLIRQTEYRCYTGIKCRFSCVRIIRKNQKDYSDNSRYYRRGSYAWGMPNDESDLDVMIVVQDSQEKRHKRGKPGFEALWGLGISKDLLVYTQKELEKESANPATLAHKIIKNGKCIYDCFL